jgi:hypothetical protein
MPGMRGFSWTMITFIVALCVAWLSRSWFLGLWLPPVLDVPFPFYDEVNARDRPGFERTVTITTALLLTFPVFSAEAWLLVCRMTRHEHARRLAVPFSAVSAGAVLLALWLARQIDLSRFIVLF